MTTPAFRNGRPPRPGGAAQRIDTAARALAQPMRRRRALGILGGALLAASLPGLRPRRALAQESCAGSVYGPKLCRFRQSSHCCQTDEPCCGTGCCSPNWRCCNDTGCCNPLEKQGDGTPIYKRCGCGGCCEERGCPSSRSPCGPGDTPYLYAQCCGKGAQCVRAGRFYACAPPCPRGTQRCGSKCCPRGQECVGGRCRPKCPRRQVRCGTKCCPTGQRCSNPRRGACTRCRPGQKPCGDDCCTSGEDCCGNCCYSKRTGCCMSFTDPKTGRPQTQCCSKPNRCAREVSKSGLFGTYYPPRLDSRRLCCPPDRYMGDADTVEGACCPPGTVPLSKDGNSFVLLAGSGGGMCCDEAKMCAGKCCAGAMPSAPWTEATCCNGQCVQLATDSSHCGACGRSCGPGERCEDSTCIPA